MAAQHAGTPPPSSMLLSGIVPPLADSFYQRPESGLALRGGLYPGDTVVLIQDEPTAAGPAGQGGTGKTQLAVSYAYALWSIRAVEVLFWVTAASREAIVTGYAEGARTVGAGLAGGAGGVGAAGGAGFPGSPGGVGSTGGVGSAGGVGSTGGVGNAGGVGFPGSAGGVGSAGGGGFPGGGGNVGVGGLAELGLRAPGLGDDGRGEQGLGLGAEAAAERFVGWMGATGRRWALILDDLRDPADLEQLWPAGPAGQVVMTTRLAGQGLDALMAAAGRNSATGAGSRPPNLRIAPVGGFTEREALSYLSSRLTDIPGQRIGAVDLGQDLDGLPLGLAQAAAVMKLSGLSCREYRALLAERIGHMPAVPGVSAAVLATWSIAAECAHELPPTGLAWPALVLAAMLDHHGVPGAVLTSPASCGYIAGRPSTEIGRAHV